MKQNAQAGCGTRSCGALGEKTTKKDQPKAQLVGKYGKRADARPSKK
jgi:hypothetical protein